MLYNMRSCYFIFKLWNSCSYK